MGTTYLVDGDDLTYEANQIRAKTGGGSPIEFVAGKGFGDAIAAIPSGGGGSGATKIASGTFTGNDGYAVDLPVGTKMPKTNFAFRMWLDNAEIVNATKYQCVCLYYTIFSPDYFDFSSDGIKYRATTYSVVTDYNGSRAAQTVYKSREYVVFIKEAGTVNNQLPADSNTMTFTRANTGFTANVTLWNPNNHFANGQTYKWEITYFGSDPSNEIVEVP